MSGAAPDTPPSTPPAGSGLWARMRERDHTRGHLAASLFVLAAPLLATSLSQVVFQLSDLKFISDIGEEAVTAVVVTNQSFRQVVMILVMGAGFGAQGMISRMVGQGRIDDADHAAGQIVTAGFLVSIAVAAVGLLFGEPMLAVMNVAPHVQELALPYLRIAFCMSFGWIFATLFGAILGGAGDATTPMLITLLQLFVSLSAEFALVYGYTPFPEYRVESIAVGQALGQLVGMTIALSVLFRGRARVHVRLRHLAPDPAVLRQLFRQAWAPAFQMVANFLVNVYFLRLAGDFGDKAQAAYSIGLRISMVGPMLAFPLAGACATLVGQNLGAGSVRRAWHSLWVGLAAHASLLCTVGTALLVWREPFVRLFADDPDVIALGSELVLYQAGSFYAWAFYFVCVRALQGAGDVVVPMALSTMNALLVTLPAGWYLATQAGRGPTGLFQATLIGAVVVTFALGLYVATGRWTRVGRRIAGARLRG